MPIFSIGFPCKVATERVIASFCSVLGAAIREDAEIIVGIQDIIDSDPKIVDFLSRQPRTRVVYTNAYSNLSGTLNHIISNSNGRYFIRTDDDDFMHPLRVSKLHEVIKNGIDFAILGQAYKCFAHDRLGPLVTPATKSIDNKMKLLLGVPFGHPAITIDLSKIGQNPYDVNQVYAQDYMLYVNMIKKGSYLGFDHLATYYRLPTNATSSQMQKRRRQLNDHERAMRMLWNKLSPINITSEQIHILRSTLVTSEFADMDIKNQKRWCFNMLKEGSNLLRDYIGDA